MIGPDIHHLSFNLTKSSHGIAMLQLSRKTPPKEAVFRASFTAISSSGLRLYSMSCFLLSSGDDVTKAADEANSKEDSIAFSGYFL
jgi:hypothetical protein